MSVSEIESVCDSVFQKASKFFFDKRVVLVGPSAHLVDQGLGEEIDSFDIVVRINRQWPIAENLYPDYGKRTDVLFHSCASDHKLPDEILSPSYPKLVFYENNGEAERLLRACAVNDIDAYNLTCWWHLVRCRIGTFPFTGNVAIDFLMATKLKQLWIIGFSMHQSQTVSGYPSDGAKEYEEHFALHKIPPSRIWCHDISLNCLHLQEFFENEVKRVVVDPLLAEIVEQNCNWQVRFKRWFCSMYHLLYTWRLMNFRDLRNQVGVS